MPNAYCQRLQIQIEDFQKALNPSRTPSELTILEMQLIKAANFLQQLLGCNLSPCIERVPLCGGERVYVLSHSEAKCWVADEWWGTVLVSGRWSCNWC